MLSKNYNKNSDFVMMPRKSLEYHFTTLFYQFRTPPKGQLISKQDSRAITSPSFFINLEVVILEVEILRLFFGRSYGSTILFRD